MPFCNPNGIWWFQLSSKSEDLTIYRLGYKKAQKIIKIVFSKNMDPKLSNDVFIMFKKLLKQILRFHEVWSKTAK